MKQILAVSAIILMLPNTGNWKVDTANAKVNLVYMVRLERYMAASQV
jgi:hypothetical protein